MKTFKYKVLNKGKIKSGILTSSTINEAAIILKRADNIIIELHHAETSADSTSSLSFLDKDLKGFFVRSKDMELALRYLSILIKGGVPILSALEICAEQVKGYLGESLLAVGEKIQNGLSLEESIKIEMPFFHPLYLGLIKVGESNGSLDVMFNYASSLIERKRRIRNNVIQAMIYPLIVVFMSIGAGLYITTIAIPKIAPLLTQKGRRLPFITQLLLDVSSFIRDYWIIIIICPILFIILLILAKKNIKIGEKIDFILLKLPVLGEVFRTSSNAIWTRSMGILLKTGINIIQAIHLTEQSITNLHYKKEFSVVREKITTGIPLSEALESTTIKNITPLAMSMIKVGENTGTVDDGLLYTAEFNEEALDRRLEFISKIIEPILLVTVGGMVGFIYIAFFIGLMAVTRSAGL